MLNCLLYFIGKLRYTIQFWEKESDVMCKQIHSFIYYELYTKHLNCDYILESTRFACSNTNSIT